MVHCLSLPDCSSHTQLVHTNWMGLQRHILVGLKAYQMMTSRGSQVTSHIMVPFQPSFGSHLHSNATSMPDSITQTKSLLFIGMFRGIIVGLAIGRKVFTFKDAQFGFKNWRIRKKQSTWAYQIWSFIESNILFRKVDHFHWRRIHFGITSKSSVSIRSCLFQNPSIFPLGSHWIFSKCC